MVFPNSHINIFIWLVLFNIRRNENWGKTSKKSLHVCVIFYSDHNGLSEKPTLQRKLNEYLVELLKIRSSSLMLLFQVFSNFTYTAYVVVHLPRYTQAGTFLFQ
jgi:hypothetical protein